MFQLEDVHNCNGRYIDIWRVRGIY